MANDGSPKNGRSEGIQVIARAAAILRVLRKDTSGMSLGQIAERVALPRSTVQRIVSALQTERLIITSRASGSIRLGPEITALSESAHYSVVEECRLTLSALSERLGETADLSVFRGTGMIFLDQVPGIHRLRAISSVGEVFPLTTTANGRATLAMLPDAEAEKLARDEWARRDIDGNWQDFLATLTNIRKSGLAWDKDEHTDGISAIGAAFRDLNGEIHAISVPVPTSRFRQKRKLMESGLRAALVEIENHFSNMKPDAN